LRTGGVFLWGGPRGLHAHARTEMWMPKKNGCGPPAEGDALAETQLTPRDCLHAVYGFILQAVKGDKATADAIFEDYLAGKLSEDLLSISRRCVNADQAGSSNRGQPRARVRLACQQDR
jgi:hypothetical protein